MVKIRYRESFIKYYICFTSLLGILLLSSCAGLGEVSPNKSYEIDIPEDMPFCPEGGSTVDEPCFEGRLLDGELKSTCGRYWRIYPDNIQRATMERTDCCVRNTAVLWYYLTRNRSQLKFLANELEEGNL